jgi:hypothetical protein
MMGSPFPSYYASKRIGEFCIFGGVAYGVLAHIIIFERAKHELFEAGLFFAPALGAIVGATIAPIAYFLLRKRELTDCLPILGWVGIVATVLTSGLPWQNPVSASLFGAPLTLVFTALILNRLMPRIYDRPGLCRRCGYDIRASFEMGRCPECGRPFAEPLSRNDKTPAGWKKTIWMIWNHPIAVVAFVVFAYLAFLAFTDTPRWPTQAFDAAARQAMENNQPLELFESTDFDWSQCHVFPAYTPRATMNEEPGFRWRCVSRPNLSRSETQQILAFVEESRVVSYCVLPYATRMNGFEFKGPSPFARDVLFDVGYCPDTSNTICLTPIEPYDLGSTGSGANVTEP